MRDKQIESGYEEINTPQVVDRKLWEESGHWDKYRENMFITEIDEEHANEKRTNALKANELPLPCSNLQSRIKILSEIYRLDLLSLDLVTDTKRQALCMD